MSENRTYVDEDGKTVHVIDPMRILAMELMELHGMTEDDLGTGTFEGLVEHMREGLKGDSDSDD